MIGKYECFSRRLISFACGFACIAMVEVTRLCASFLLILVASLAWLQHRDPQPGTQHCAVDDLDCEPACVVLVLDGCAISYPCERCVAISRSLTVVGKRDSLVGEAEVLLVVEVKLWQVLGMVVVACRLQWHCVQDLESGTHQDQSTVHRDVGNRPLSVRQCFVLVVVWIDPEERLKAHSRRD